MIISVFAEWSNLEQLTIFATWVFLSLDIHESQGSRGKGKSILISFYHSRSLHGHIDINWVITTERSPVVTDIEPRIFTFWVQVINHWNWRPYKDIYVFWNKILRIILQFVGTKFLLRIWNSFILKIFSLFKGRGKRRLFVWKVSVITNH